MKRKSENTETKMSNRIQRPVATKATTRKLVDNPTLDGMSSKSHIALCLSQTGYVTENFSSLVPNPNREYL